MTTFDIIEFKVLKCADPNGMGYYPEDTEEGKRAITLIKEGILKDNIKDWWKEGYKFTDQGFKYFEDFMKKVAEKHGHVWKTYNDSYSDDFDIHDNIINTFAYSSGYHNGPECKNCGFTFCMHCTPEFDIPACSERK